MSACRYILFIIFTTIIFIGIDGCSTSKKMNDKVMQQQDSLLNNLLSKYPHYFKSVIRNKKELNVQIIYTQIDRDKKNHPTFTDHYFNVNKDAYFYPASTVKLPVAVLTLQRLNELNIKVLDKYTPMITEADSDGQTAFTMTLQQPMADQQ
jgi:Beta-lactamase enzyme family